MGNPILSSTTEHTSTVSSCEDTYINYCMAETNIVLIILFVIIQISIWAFLIFCYFSKTNKRRQQRESKFLSQEAPQDFPPDYEIAKDKTSFPPFSISSKIEELPTYNQVVLGVQSPV